MNGTGDHRQGGVALYPLEAKRIHPAGQGTRGEGVAKGMWR